MKLTTHTKLQFKGLDYLYKSTELCEIMGRNKSDKGNKDLTRSHNYTTIYSLLFKELRSKPIELFELGLGTNNIDVPSNMGAMARPGASLYGWAEFFPEAKIYGADIDQRILFNTERIHTFHCDQTNPDSIYKLWNQRKIRDKQFDIIIEDGYHNHYAQICFFENSIHKVKPGGYYIIEDINHGIPFNLMCEQFQYYKANNQYPDLDVSIYQLPTLNASQMENGNNGLVIIKNDR